jgi:hypothetical protein
MGAGAAGGAGGACGSNGFEGVSTSKPGVWLSEVEVTESTPSSACGFDIPRHGVENADGRF